MTIDRRLMTEKVLGTGEKPAWHFTPDVTAGFTPEPSPFEQMSQEELNAQAKTLLSAAGYGPQKPLKLTLCITLQKTIKNCDCCSIDVEKEPGRRC